MTTVAVHKILALIFGFLVVDISHILCEYYIISTIYYLLLETLLARLDIGNEQSGRKK